MEERRRNDVTDGVSCWCRRCKSRKSIREGSFFCFFVEVDTVKVVDRTFGQENTLWKMLLMKLRCKRKQQLMCTSNGRSVLSVIDCRRIRCSWKSGVNHPNWCIPFLAQTKSCNYDICGSVLFRIIGEEQQPGRCGFSAWWTHLTPHTWATCRLYPAGMQLPSFQ